MYAILETGGKQYKVQEGDIIEVEHINQKNISKDMKVNFAEVLLIQDKELSLGQPYVQDARIQARILGDFKAPKIIVFKKKSKKGYKRTRGHRQLLHRLKIEKIEIKKAAKDKKEGAAPEKKETGAAKTKTAKKTPTAGKKTTATKPGKKKTTSKSVKKSTASKTGKTAAASKSRSGKTTKKEKEKK